MELNEYELEALQELEKEKKIGEIQKSGLTLEQIRLEKEAKFKAMGVPIPMPVAQPHMIKNINNPSALSKIEEIKRGNKKNLFNKIDAIAEGKLNTFQEIPVPQPSQNQQRNKNQNPNFKKPGAVTGSPSPKIQTFDVPSAIQDPALLEIMENFNNTDSRSVGAYSTTQIKDDTGTDFISNIRGKLQNKLKDKATTLEQNNYTHFAQQSQPVASPVISTTSPLLASGMVLIDENDLKKKIYAISQSIFKKEIAKVEDAIKLSEQKFAKSLFDVKNILNEYLKMPKNIIVESDKVKKAEIVGENIVKINGKFYKLSPVTLKTKE